VRQVKAKVNPGGSSCRRIGSVQLQIGRGFARVPCTFTAWLRASAGKSKARVRGQCLRCTKGRSGGIHHETRIGFMHRHRNPAGFGHGPRPTICLPDQAGAHRRALSGRRPDRPDRAAGGAKTRRAAGTVVLRGKRGGCQRCRRRRAGRPRDTGRLHAPGLDQRLCRRFGDQYQPALRPGEEFLAGQSHRHVAAGGGRQSVGAGEKP